MTSPTARWCMRLAVITIGIIPVAFAQMGGGGSSNSGGMMGGNGSGMGGPGTMTGGMGDLTSGPVVGPDGSAYVLRQTGTNSQGMMNGQTAATELVAISPAGKTVWTVPIDGTMVSQPVLSKDGFTIYVTTSEPEMNHSTGAGMNGTATSSTLQRKPALVIIANSLTSARVQNRVEIDADMLSIPRISPDGQTIYVTAFDMPEMTGRVGATTHAVNAALYAFSPTGALKSKTDLGNYRMGGMRR